MMSTVTNAIDGPSMPITAMPESEHLHWHASVPELCLRHWLSLSMHFLDQFYANRRAISMLRLFVISSDLT